MKGDIGQQTINGLPKHKMLWEWGLDRLSTHKHSCGDGRLRNAVKD